MIAVVKGHMDVVKVMMKEDPGLMSMPVGSATTVIHWAQEEGHHCHAFFKVQLFLSNFISSLLMDTLAL